MLVASRGRMIFRQVLLLGCCLIASVAVAAEPVSGQLPTRPAMRVHPLRGSAPSVDASQPEAAPAPERADTLPAAPHDMDVPPVASQNENSSRPTLFENTFPNVLERMNALVTPTPAGLPARGDSAEPAPVAPAATPDELRQPEVIAKARFTVPAANKPALHWEAESLDYHEPPAPEPVNVGSLVWRLVFGTGAVLAACFGSLWLAKRWLPGGAMLPKARGRMRIVDSLSLGQRCWIQLVEIEGRPVLIGYDAGGLRNVTPLVPSFADQLAHDPEQPDGQRSPLAERETSKSEFSEYRGLQFATPPT